MDTNMLNRAGRLLVPALVTAVAVAVLVVVVDLGQLVDGVKQGDWRWIGSGLILSIVPTLARTVRLGVMLGCSIDCRLFRTAAVHGAMVAVVPAKLGEAALPIMLNRSHGRSVPEAIGMLLTIRIYDLGVLISAGCLLLALHASDIGLARWRWPLVALGIAGLTGLFLMPSVARAVRASWLGRHDTRTSRVSILLSRLTGALSGIGVGGGLRILVLTILVWSTLFALFAVSNRAFDLGVAPTAGVLGGIAGSLAFALPVNGVANIGPFEAAWSATTSRFGGEPATAVIAAFFCHTAIIMASVASAGLGIFLAARAR